MDSLECKSENLFINSGLSKINPFYEKLISASSTTDNFLNRRFYFKDKLYNLIFDNVKASYRSRNINYEIASNSSVKNVVQFDQELPDNAEQNYNQFQLFLDYIISELEENNFNLFKISDEIKRVCFEENLTIKRYSAFYKIQDWDNFIEIIHALSECSLNYKFEMLSSLIVQYAEICGQMDEDRIGDES